MPGEEGRGDGGEVKGRADGVEFGSHHGLCDEQQQHGLLHHVLRTEASAGAEETGNEGTVD